MLLNDRLHPVAQERAERTLGLLLSRPVSRRTVLIGKAAALQIVATAVLLALPGFVPAPAAAAEPVQKHFMIVAPKSFHDALKDYAEYKRKDLPTESGS